MLVASKQERRSHKRGHQEPCSHTSGETGQRRPRCLRCVHCVAVRKLLVASLVAGRGMLPAGESRAAAEPTTRFPGQRRVRSVRAYPLAHWFASFHRQVGETQPAGFQPLVHPHQVALNLDSAIMIPKPQTNCLISLQLEPRRGNRVRLRTHSTRCRHCWFDVDVSEPFHGFP